MIDTPVLHFSSYRFYADDNLLYLLKTRALISKQYESEHLSANSFVAPSRHSLLSDEDVGPHLVHRVDGSFQAVLHHGPLDVQHTGGVVGAAVVYHVPDTIIEVFHHQLLGGFEHGLRDGLCSYCARWQLCRGMTPFVG